ncbi:AraC family transcriptional regulator [Actinophytocola gossypii]|uniref:AraC family transcriptional regulator n=1 Tax=Actinophytocola gossypii TaxID=2812003 RepID=A0ABT2JBX1_9PSEU|nr:helix-turn-helix domain-containing protein [Actinophytocola gossypii]MCT2585359.1 AraC family transcriptional regulator [Actinophytocola gossypii]
MSTVPEFRHTSGRPAPALRGLLARDYAGFTQPPSTRFSWVATAAPTATVIVNLHGDITGLPSAFAAGPSDTHRVVEQTGAVECADLKLTPLGAYRLLGTPMAALTGLAVDLTDLLGPAGATLVPRMAEAPTWVARFALLDAFLLDRLASGPTPAPEVEWVWRRMVERGGNVLVGNLAAEVGWSRRHLVARFRQQVGLTPKTAARVLRFDTVLRRLPAGPPARVAVECGYYDQSHLDRDFREFAGTTPSAYLGHTPSEVTFFQYGWSPAA